MPPRAVQDRRCRRRPLPEWFAAVTARDGQLGTVVGEQFRLFLEDRVQLPPRHDYFLVSRGTVPSALRCTVGVTTTATAVLRMAGSPADASVVRLPEMTAPMHALGTGDPQRG